MKRSSNEDLTVIKDDKGNKLFREEEVKLHTMNYFKELYTKRDYNQQRTNFINNQVKKCLKNDASKNTTKTLHCMK